MALHQMIQCILLFSYSMFHCGFDVTDTDMIIELDAKKLETLAVLMIHWKSTSLICAKQRRTRLRLAKIIIHICFTEKKHFLIFSHFNLDFLILSYLKIGKTIRQSCNFNRISYLKFMVGKLLLKVIC